MTCFLQEVKNLGDMYSFNSLYRFFSLQQSVSETNFTLEEVPYFQSRVKPKPYVEPQKPKKPNLIVRMIRALVGT